MDKQDLSQIKSIIQENNEGLLAKVQVMIKEALFQFWDQVLEPNIAMKSDVEEVKVDLELVKNKLGGVDQRLVSVEGRLGSVEERLGSVQDRLGTVERKLDASIATQDNLEPRVRKLESKVL